jgi:CRISPR-associated exonuclease Cas4
MSSPELPDYIPIAYLNALEYCHRRFYYEFALGEMIVNEHVLEGALRHEGVDTTGVRTEEGVLRRRRMYVYSDRLRLVGFADLVELSGGEWRPVEYKKGRMGRWLNDHIQLCAQALCLEERLGVSIERGFMFYFGSRRREEVPFTAALRSRTEAAVERAFALLAAGRLPDPIEEWRKCRDCSLEPLCLPREVRQLRGEPARN